MEPISHGLFAKFAPVIFLTAVKEGGARGIDWPRLGHTLILAAIVAVATRYETVRAIEVKMEYMEKSVAKIAVLAEEAIKVQREVIPMRNLQVKNLQDEVKNLREKIEAMDEHRPRKTIRGG